MSDRSIDLGSISFMINEYDSDGDILEEGIFINFGHTRLKICETLDEFDKFVHIIKGIQKEIGQEYPELRGVKK